MIYRVGIVFGFLALAGPAFGQTKVVVMNEGEFSRVVAMDAEYPVIDDGRGGRQRIYSSKLSLVKADYFTDGGVRILEKDAVMGQDYGVRQGGFFFRFKARLQADRDFEDCFVLFLIAPSQGSETILMQPLRDLLAGEPETVEFTVPANPGFGTGYYSYHLYSKGEEIQVDDPSARAAIRRIGDAEGIQQKPGLAPRETPPEAFPPKAVRVALPDFPASLVGKASGGAATVVFTIDARGGVAEILALESDRAAFAVEARRCVLESRYQAASFRGSALQTTVRQQFFFNEFASMAEGLEVIGRPDLRDRDPLPLRLAVARQGSGREAKGSAVLEATVDRLGNAVDPRIVEASGEAFARAALDAAESWVFQPAIGNGEAVARRIKIPVTAGSD